MKILAIDTSTNACSVALLHDTDIIVNQTTAPMQQAKLILPMIDLLLVENGLTLHQLDALAFGCGPGSFTGVRIATSVMQGLAYASDLPLLAVSSLAAIAKLAHTQLGWHKTLVTVDARMSEVYYGAYQVTSQGFVELVGQEAVGAPQHLILPTETDWYGAGDGWGLYKDQLAYQPRLVDPTLVPMASAIAELAKVQYDRAEWVSPAMALPVYLRNNVAIKSHRPGPK